MTFQYIRISIWKDSSSLCYICTLITAIMIDQLIMVRIISIQYLNTSPQSPLPNAEASRECLNFLYAFINIVRQRSVNYSRGSFALSVPLSSNWLGRSNSILLNSASQNGSVVIFLSLGRSLDQSNEVLPFNEEHL